MPVVVALLVGGVAAAPGGALDGGPGDHPADCGARCAGALDAVFGSTDQLELATAGDRADQHQGAGVRHRRVRTTPRPPSPRCTRTERRSSATSTSAAGELPAATELVVPEIGPGSTNGWPGERWLDIRRLDILGPIMQRRLDMCAAKGFDAVEFDNVDGYTNRTGFPLTAPSSSATTCSANQAHRRGISVGLKNDTDQIPRLLPYFDFALNEQCHQYHECDRERLREGRQGRVRRGVQRRHRVLAPPTPPSTSTASGSASISTIVGIRALPWKLVTTHRGGYLPRGGGASTTGWAGCHGCGRVRCR